MAIDEDNISEHMDSTEENHLDGVQNLSLEDMDELLERALIEAIKTRVYQDITFYSSVFSPVCRLWLISVFLSSCVRA